MDLQVIATALATTIGTVTANNESATATAQLPNQVGKLALLVYPPAGELSIGVNRMRDDKYVFPVKLLRDPVNMPDRTSALYAWATALRDLVEKNLDLGLAYVAVTEVFGLRMEIDGEPYADTTGVRGAFDVVEFSVRVRVREVVATVSM